MEEFGTVQENCSYHLSGMMVCEYQGKKYLSASKASCKIEGIDDIGDVEVDDEMMINRIAAVECKSGRIYE